MSHSWPLRKSLEVCPLPFTHGPPSPIGSAPDVSAESSHNDQSHAATRRFSIGWIRRLRFTLCCKCSSAPPYSISVTQTDESGRFWATIIPNQPHPAPSSRTDSPGFRKFSSSCMASRYDPSLFAASHTCPIEKLSAV